MITHTSKKLTTFVVALTLVFGVVLGSTPKADAAFSSPVLLGKVDVSTQLIRQVAVNEVTGKVYLAGNFAQSGLTIVDASDPTNPFIQTTVSSGGGTTVDPSTNKFYTSGGYSGTLLTYNGSTNTLIDTDALGYCGGFFDHNSSMVFMISQCGPGNDPIHVLNTNTNSIIAGPLATGGVASHVLVNSATGKIYASNWRSPSGLWSRVFNTSPTVSFLSDVQGHTRAINPVSNKIYTEVAFDQPNVVSVLDGTSHALIATIPGAETAGNTDVYGVDTSLDKIYIPDSANGHVKVIDGSTNSIMGTFTLESGFVPAVHGPIAVDSVNHRIYVVGTNGSTKYLYIYDDSGLPTIDDIITEVASLAPPLNSGQANALTQKLENEQLKAFINQVEAFMKAGILTPEQGQSLIDKAEYLLQL